MKEKIPMQSMQIPVELKKEIDAIKIIPDETYPSVIQRLVDNYKENNKKEKV